MVQHETPVLALRPPEAAKALGISARLQQKMVDMLAMVGSPKALLDRPGPPLPYLLAVPEASIPVY